MKSNGLFPLFTVMVLTLAACAAPQEVVSPTAPVASEAPATARPELSPTAPSLGLSPDQQLAQIDDILKKTTEASIAYNAPSGMRVDETVTIELLLNPKVSEEDLKKEISESGAINTSSVQITPVMKARLIAQDSSAFDVKARPDEEHALQVISGTETTKWSWDVTARKAGTHRLTISLSRLVKYDNEEFWREVGEYEADIVVQVTWLNRLQVLGWPCLLGSLIGLAAVSVVLLRRGQAKKKSGPRRVHPGNEDLGRIFLSYRRSDSADIAGRIYDRLVEQFGREPIFKDVDSIPLGIDFREDLDRKVRECRVLLAIIGDHWLDARDEMGKVRLEDPGDFVRIEIESALASGIPVIPLLVRGAQMPREESLPPSLRNLVYKNGVQIRPDPDFHHDMDRLSAALSKYMNKAAI